ncbi:MAG: hypothetical protein ACI85Z_001348, partial [Rheinheimera aquimaris]
MATIRKRGNFYQVQIRRKDYPDQNQNPPGVA